MAMQANWPRDDAITRDMEIACDDMPECFFTGARDDGRCFAELEEPLILIHDAKLSQSRPIYDLLKRLGQPCPPLLFIGGGVEDDALAVLKVNHARGAFMFAAAEVLDRDVPRRATLKKLARLTGGKIVGRKDGIKLDDVTLDFLGKAKKVRIEESEDEILGTKTTIYGGLGTPPKSTNAASPEGAGVTLDPQAAAPTAPSRLAVRSKPGGGAVKMSMAVEAMIEDVKEEKISYGQLRVA
jgi:hypothetical protein